MILTLLVPLSASEDYGKTFKDVTHLINHTFVQTEFGIAISPDHSGKVSTTETSSYQPESNGKQAEILIY